MDFTFSAIQSYWKEAAAGFVRNCPPPPSADENSGAEWLKRAVADSRDAGLFDCALTLESGGTGFDLLALCLVAEELVRLDTGFCMAFLNRSLCYRAGSLLMSGEVRRSFSDALRAMPAPLGAVVIWPDGGTTATLDGSQLRIDEIVSLAQPETTHCLGWVPDDSRGMGFLASGKSLAQSIKPAAFDGFRTLRLNRLTGLLARIHRSEAPDFAAAGAERALLFAAAGVGLAQAGLDYALDYSRGRMSFEKPLCQHQAVALRLADMAIRIESARLLLWAACGSGPQNPPDPKEAAQCWNYCARVAADAASWACQLLGGHGFLTDHPLALWLREIHMVRLLGGQAAGTGTDLP